MLSIALLKSKIREAYRCTGSVPPIFSVKETVMLEQQLKLAFVKMNRIEAPLCRIFNRFSERRILKSIFAGVSRLGNGAIWYALAAILPAVYGAPALETVLQMFIAGFAGLYLYKRVKAGTTRPRPYMTHETIQWKVAPLDRYSFPSGHTLHAVAFSVIICRQHPELTVLLLPFCLLVALSRVILGLHYPSDVLVGALTGYTLAEAALLINL